MDKEQIKKLISKFPLFTLCAFSLPFMVHGSSLEVPKRIESHRHSRGETGYVELDAILESKVQRPSLPLITLFYDGANISLSDPAVKPSNRMKRIKKFNAVKWQSYLS